LGTAASWSRVAEYTGLSEYEAKVYVSLIEHGLASARKLSMSCEVPRTKLYSTIKKLIEMGLVVEVPGKTKIYFTAVSPEVSLKSNLLVIRNRAEEFESIVASLTDTHRCRQTLIDPQKIDCWVVHGRRKVFDKIKDLLTQAKNSVDIITNGNGVVLFFRTSHKILDKLKENGVKVTLTSTRNLDKTFAKELSYICEVRTCDLNYLIFYICVDQKQFILTKMDPNSSELDSDSDFGILSEDASLLSLISLLLRKPASKVSKAVDTASCKTLEERG